MILSRRAWIDYINKLRRCNEAAAQAMSAYLAAHGTADTQGIIEYAYAVASKYGEASAALAAEMYDATAALAAAQNAGGASELEKANKRLADLEKELTSMKAADAVRQLREKVAADKNIPASLLTGDTEETCAAQADAILAFAGNTGSLSVGDKGEAGGGAADARAQFTAWAKDNI